MTADGDRRGRLPGVRRRWLGIPLVVVAGVLVAALATPGPEPHPAAHLELPAARYDHPPLHEDSTAVPVAGAGEVGAFAAGLAEVGYACAQVRANDRARQVWCRAVAPPAPGATTPAVTTVDLVSTPDGRLEYARLNPPPPTLRPGYADPDRVDRLTRVLDATFLRQWPDDARVVRALVADVDQADIGLTTSRNDGRPLDQQSARTGHAVYTVSEVPVPDGVDEDVVSGYATLALTVTTDALEDRSWPYGSEHYAVTTEAAGPGLEAGGFDCYAPAESPCTRPAGNQQVDYVTRPGTDQVVTARVGVGGGVLDPAVGVPSLASAGFPAGLTFLTEDVRSAVEQRLDDARRTGESWAGIVAGTVLVLDADATPRQPDGTYAVHVDLTVGAPLAALPALPGR